MEKKEEIEKQAHDFERYKIEQEFNKSLDREISVDLARTFEDEDDFSYSGAHFDLEEEIISKALDSVMDKGTSKREYPLIARLGKLRKRIMRGHR